MSKKFLHLGTTLTRDQAKKITGGFAEYTCTYTYNDGPPVTVTITANNGTAAQCLADNRCWNDDHCTNADCTDTGACL